MPASAQAVLASGDLRVTVQPDTVVALGGELDLDTAPKLRAVLADVLADERTAEVTLDMADLEFIDSTGLRIIVETVSVLGERGGRLVIRRARPAILKVLDICGLTQSVRLATD